jgi:hypothetical protein
MLQTHILAYNPRISPSGKTKAGYPTYRIACSFNGGRNRV